MNILMTADTIGGVWRYALELARGLEPFGVNILLATMGAPLSTEQRREVAALRHVRVTESRYKLVWMDDPWADIEAAGDWLLRLAENFKPALIHLNDYPHGALPWSAPVLMVGHSCVLSWWQAVHGVPAPARLDRYRDAVRTGLRAANGVIAPTAAMLAELHRLYGPLLAARVIFNGRTVQPQRKKRLSSSRPAVSGTRGRTSPASPGLRLACPGPSMSPAKPGIQTAPQPSSRTCVAWGRFPRSGSRTGLPMRRSMPFPPVTSPSDCRSWKQPRRDARWCSATSRVYAKFGRTLPYLYRRTIPSGWLRLFRN